MQAAGVRGAPETALFSRWAQGYASERFGQPIAVLLAGAVTAAGDLGAAGLRATGADLSVGLVDDDQPVTRAARDSHPGLARCTLGDLRTVPLPQRSFDIVQATLLLERIEHAELVLDRLVGAIKPGGLLCLQVRDRDTAAGFLDRVLPGWIRQVIWRAHRPGRPGPHPAVYERVASARGVQSYALMRGLVIAQQQPLGGLAGGLHAAPRGYLAAQKMVAALSGAGCPPRMRNSCTSCASRRTGLRGSSEPDPPRAPGPGSLARVASGCLADTHGLDHPAPGAGAAPDGGERDR